MTIHESGENVVDLISRHLGTIDPRKFTSATIESFLRMAPSIRPDLVQEAVNALVTRGELTATAVFLCSNGFEEEMHAKELAETLPEGFVTDPQSNERVYDYVARLTYFYSRPFGSPFVRSECPDISFDSTADSDPLTEWMRTVTEAFAHFGENVPTPGGDRVSVKLKEELIRYENQRNGII